MDALGEFPIVVMNIRVNEVGDIACRTKSKKKITESNIKCAF